MSHNAARDQRSGGRGTVEARRRRRLRSTLLALEDRALLSTFTVSNTNDAGANSLRQAIIDDNSTPGADKIVFSSLFNTPQTITLTSGQLNIGDDLTIQGPGANNLTVSGNNASRVFEASGTPNFTISGLTIANGSSDFGGGMDFAFTSGTLTIQNCVFSGNSASMTGGGLQVFGNGASATIVNVSNTTFANNQAAFTGAANFGNTTATLSNCTISGNRASVVYGGLGVGSSGSGQTAAATLTYCTIAGNSGPFVGGLEAYSQFGASATAQYVNTIFANNSPQNVSFFGPTSVISLGHNISDDGTGNLTGPGDQPNTNPLLAPLNNYGGPTPTMALSPGSPAIDAGVTVPGVTTDQRGVPRPQGSAPDIGAFEAVAPTVLALQRFGFHAQPTALVLTFSTALDPTRAQDLHNYRLAGSHGHPIRIVRAVYDPTAYAVTLRPAVRLSLRDSFVLTVNGRAPNGLTSATGLLLDGSGRGQPGSNFVRKFGGDAPPRAISY